MQAALRGFLSLKLNPSQCHKGRWGESVYKKTATIKLTKTQSAFYYHHTPEVLNNVSEKIPFPLKKFY